MLLGLRILGYLAVAAGLVLMGKGKFDNNAELWTWGAYAACPGIVLVLLLDVLGIARRFRKRD